MECPKDVIYTVRSFDERAIGETGDQGIQGITGVQGEEGDSDYLTGQGIGDPMLTMTDVYQPFVSRTIALLGDPNPSVPAIGDQTLPIGTYFVIFKGEVRMVSDNAYIGGRLSFDGSPIVGSEKHIGDIDYANNEPSVFGAYFNIKLQGRINVTDVSQVLDAEFRNEAIGTWPLSKAEIYRGTLIIIKAGES